MSARRELEALWADIRAHLALAVELLPARPVPGDEGGSIAGYLEYLEHNELELAFDELEQLGAANDVPSSFWRQLTDAATLMGLDGRADACRARIRPS